jgi:hypothetical protein
VSENKYLLATIDNTKLASTDNGVLVTLARHANWGSGVCFPSVATIQAKSGLSRDAIQRSLKHLEGHGVFRKNTDQKVNHYTLDLDAITSYWCSSDCNLKKRRPRSNNDRTQLLPSSNNNLAPSSNNNLAPSSNNNHKPISELVSEHQRHPPHQNEEPPEFVDAVDALERIDQYTLTPHDRAGILKYLVENKVKPAHAIRAALSLSSALEMRDDGRWHTARGQSYKTIRSAYYNWVANAKIHEERDANQQASGAQRPSPGGHDGAFKGKSW